MAKAYLEYLSFPFLKICVEEIQTYHLLISIYLFIYLMMVHSCDDFLDSFTETPNLSQRHLHYPFIPKNTKNNASFCYY